MSAGRYIFVVLGLSLLLWLGVIGFNFYVDPFTYYHRPWTEMNLSKNQRHANAGLARNYDYEVAVVGTSHIMEISSSRLSELAGKPAINLPFTAGLAREMAILAELILEQGKADTVAIEMNFPSFALGDVVSDYPDIFPGYLYEPRFEMPLRYLMSFDTMKAAFAALDEPGRVTLDNKDEIAPREYGRDRVVAAWNFLARTWNDERMAFWRDHQASIETPSDIIGLRFVPLFEKYPDVRFELFLPPNSILYFVQHMSMGASDFQRWLAFRNFIGDTAERYPNVRVHDFQSQLALMTDLSQYRDLLHFHPSQLDRMFQQLFAGSRVADAATVQRNSALLRERAITFGRTFCAAEAVECSNYLIQQLSP